MNASLIVAVFCSIILTREIHAIKCYKCRSMSILETDGCHHGGATDMKDEHLVECAPHENYCYELITTLVFPSSVRIYSRGCRPLVLDLCLTSKLVYRHCFRSCKTDGCNGENDLREINMSDGSLPTTPSTSTTAQP